MAVAPSALKEIVVPVRPDQVRQALGLVGDGVRFHQFFAEAAENEVKTELLVPAEKLSSVIAGLSKAKAEEPANLDQIKNLWAF